MPYSEAVRPTRLVYSQLLFSQIVLDTLQCDFSAIRYKHRGKRLCSRRNGSVVSYAVRGEQPAREVSRLSKGTHVHSLKRDGGRAQSVLQNYVPKAIVCGTMYPSSLGAASDGFGVEPRYSWRMSVRGECAPLCIRTRATRASTGCPVLRRLRTPLGEGEGEDATACQH